MSAIEVDVKPIIVSSGEPAGIGPDLCIELLDHEQPIVVLADPDVLYERATLLGKPLKIELYQFDSPHRPRPGHLLVHPIPCPVTVKEGVLNPEAAPYVIEMLRRAAQFCMEGKAAALVTAPVHKAIINQAGISFTGHTEFFAELTESKTVMLLASRQLKVSLVTTHIPLHAVSSALNQALLRQHLNILYRSLQRDFGIERPRLKVLGLNPHAGEEGYLGREEQIVIGPVIEACQQQGMSVFGPYSADTAFLDLQDCDAVVAMYHDQGLPVLKYASFGEAANVSCGLPFIRTSVDHGTALPLAGTGLASVQSLLTAIHTASEIMHHHAKN